VSVILANKSRPNTIIDVAREAGVSPKTVSRVVTGKGYVSEETLKRVRSAIEMLEYRPSQAARHMRTQRSNTIGFITDYIASTPFAGAIIKGAQDVAWSQNKVLLIGNTGGKPEIEEAAVEAMLERQVEAIIYAAMWHRMVVLPPNIRNVPVVLLDCYSEDRSLPSVVPDEFQGGYDATEILLKKGHRRVAFINIDLSISIPAPTGRLAGYKAALAAYGIIFDESLIRYGNAQADSGYERTTELMRLAEPPTAIFCGNDRMAMGCYMALKELGRQIPRDVAIIGFDDQRIIAKYMRPPLSTMGLPHYAMGKWAVEYLLNQDAEKTTEAPIQHRITCPYIERESV
jgi:LacI family transcriptional regulator